MTRPFVKLYCSLLFGFIFVHSGLLLMNSLNKSFILKKDNSMLQPRERRTVENEIIHITTVVCGAKLFGDAIRWIDNILIHSTKGIKFHLVIDNVTQPLLVDYFLNLKEIQLSIYVVYYTVDDFAKYVSWIPLTDQRFFFSAIRLGFAKVLPIDLVIALDTDIIVGYDIADLWEHFTNFSEQQVIGLAEEQAPWYLESNRWPAKGMGYNAGVSLQNLGKMRKTGWAELWKSVAEEELVIRKVARLGDQDILNAAIKKYPETVYVLPCEWNIQLVRGYETSNKICGNTFASGRAKIVHNNGDEIIKLTRNKYIEEYFAKFKSRNSTLRK